MASQTRVPTTWTSVDLIGGAEWFNPNEAAVEDGEITFALVQAQSNSDYLRGTNCGFTIPAGATIDGIEVRVKKAADAVGDIFDSAAELLPGSLFAPNLDTNAWPESALTFYTYGSPTALWGGSWTPSSINDSGFGFQIAADNFDSLIENQPWVDYVEIIVYYTEPGVSLTGTPVRIENPDNNGSQSITVPADATGIVVITGGWFNDPQFYGSGAEITLDSEQLSRAVTATATSDHQHTMWWLANPATGTVTLAWDWFGISAPSDGTTIYVLFVKGSDESAGLGAIRDTDSQQGAGNTLTSGTLTAVAGDLIVAVREHFNAGTETYVWTGATKLADWPDYAGGAGSVATVSPTGDQTVACSIGYSSDGGLGAIVIKAAAGGGGGPTDTPVIIHRSQGRRW